MAIKLHYAGKEFSLPDNRADVLADYTGEAGTIKINLGEGKWLELAVGPGIPIAVESTKPGTARGIR